MIIRGRLLGKTVADRMGAVVGRVEDTYPFDGGEPEFAVVRTGRFGQRHMVPLHTMKLDGEVLVVPFSRLDLEESPVVDGARFARDQADYARAYWNTHELVDARWLGFGRVAALRD